MLNSYLKLALKVPLRRKFFTFVSLFGIAVTLTVLMVAYAVMDQLFGPRPPESARDRTLALYDVSMRGPHGQSTGPAGWYLLEHFVRDLPQVERTTFFTTGRTANSYVGGQRIDTDIKLTDGEFWRVFDFDFVEGAPYTEEDDAAGRAVAVINETTRRRFFGAGEALGRDLAVDGRTYRVVGVVRDVSMLMNLPFAEMWVPNGTRTSSAWRHEWRGNFNAVLLTRGARHFGEIRAALRARLDEAQLPDPEEYNEIEARLETRMDHAAREMFGGKKPQAALLRVTIAGATLLFMLLPAVNLINLNVSRILERASEIGVRKSFGASSATLIVQFVVENVVLTLIGGAAGLGLSLLVLDALDRTGPLPYAQFGMSWRAFAYGLGLALIFGVLSGVWPAWRMSRLHPVEALRGRSA